MSDSSRLGVSPSHRGPPQWPWEDPVDGHSKHSTESTQATTSQLQCWWRTTHRSPASVPNFQTWPGHRPVRTLAASCLILGLGRSCTSALGNTKTDRERTSRRGDGAYSEKAWTGRRRLQDRDKQKHTATSARMAHRRQRGKAWAFP